MAESREVSRREGSRAQADSTEEDSIRAVSRAAGSTEVAGTVAGAAGTKAELDLRGVGR